MLNPAAASTSPAPAARRAALPPLVPVIVPLVVAATVLSLIFAWRFPAETFVATGPVPRFTDITAASGVDFVYRHGNGPSPATLGGAVVVLDYDRDGAPDLFFLNGAPWPWEDNAWQSPGASALYRNTGNGTFSDVSAAAGLDLVFNGMGATTGDYDNDGYPDLFLTGVGGNRLLRNQRDGSFADVTAIAGVGGPDNTWNTAAAWIDFDRDGALDLVVAHYASWPQEVGLAAAFTVARIGRSYGTPVGFFSTPPTLFRNNGDGSFATVRGPNGLGAIDPETGFPRAHPLAIASVDADADGWLDLLFTYQSGEAALFLSRTEGRFEAWSAGQIVRREGLSAGVVSAGSLPLAPVASEDDFFPVIESTLEAGSADSFLLDLTNKLGFAAFDYDLDGRLELFTAHGQLETDLRELPDEPDLSGLPELRWRREARWESAQITTDVENTARLVARGIATADFDADGDLDLVIVQHGAPARIWRNDQRANLPWLRVDLKATRTHPSAGGARIEIHTPRRVLIRTVGPTQGYMAQSDTAATFGLGQDSRVRRVVVRWPSGQRQELRNPGINQTLHLIEP